MITEQQIINKTKGFAKEIFGTEFTAPIIFSNRMSKVLGLFEYYNKMSNRLIAVKDIKFSARLLNDYKESTVDSIILHELCHWFLFISNKPFYDGCYTFENELIRVGGSTTHSVMQSGESYEVTCSCCGKSLGTRNSARKLNGIRNGKYISKCCHAKIVIGEKIYTEDSFERQSAKEQWIEDVITKYSIENTPITMHKSKVIPVKSEKVAEQSIPTINNIKKEYPAYTAAGLKQLKRVTNAQMIPSIKKAIDENDRIELIILNSSFEEVYNNSLKYLGKKYTEKLHQLIG